ncbi:hypothetical protein AU156_gp158 [Edwardsiella phage PEi20]|uniref:Uncharacterized protein n=2 Tax=Kanagawavirus pei20 TaxID=2844109 RepID=A0A0B6VRQ9_9CAUD|nr:hypothetical protein AU156_gp158 [Edwardsiella phage PEi20]BAQ22944.1 hypothetical protein [Edwardsiella phage PEi20]BAQ23244.1 hypothetical protein [Edwardsiella phage PEi26]
MTIKRIYHCYECGKPIENIFSPEVFSWDDLNYFHIKCSEAFKKDE